ncbi:hypothetical protein D3C81_1805250 [compost metagenome]
MASRLLNVSISSAWRSLARLMVFSTAALTGFCNAQLHSSATGSVRTGIHASAPPIMPMTTSSSRVKGRSIMVVRVSEERKSRSD